MIKPFLILQAVAALGGPNRSAAPSLQTARDRDPLIGAFRDSLAKSDPDQLRVLERTLMAAAKRERSNPAIHLRLGLLALRLGDASDAASEFKWTTQLAPLWGLAWFGLGHAELLMGETVDTSRAGRQALLAKDAWARASQAFSRALAVDPGQIVLLDELVEQRLLIDRRAPAEVVRDGIRRAAAARGRSAAVVLGLGRTERALGDSAAAVAAFEAAATLPGGRALGTFEAARLRLTRGEKPGLEQYLEAAGFDDSMAVALVRRDLGWIATGAELERFDRVTGADRARFVGEFWAHRDRNDLRQTGERIREHYRRLAVADRLFTNKDDQRMAVMVRHGEPTSRASARLPGVPSNESWRYSRGEGDLVVHFASGADSTYFRIVGSLFDVAGDTGSPAGDDRLGGDIADQLLRSRAQLSPFYQAAASGRRDQLGPFRAREREVGQASRNLALTTDRFPLRFERDLAVRVQWLALGAQSAGPRADVVLAIPSFAELDSSGLIRLRIVVWDSTGGPVRAVDTVLMAGAQSGDGAGFLRGHLAIGLPGGRYSARAAVEVGSRGAVVTRDDLIVAAEGSDHLGDLALGSSRNRSSIQILGLGERIEVDPWGLYRRSDSLVVAGLVAVAGTVSVQPEVQVRSVRSDGKVERWRGWPDLGRLKPMSMAAGVGRVSLALPLRKLKAGVYELGLEVGLGSGRSLRRVAQFVVADDEK